MGLTLDAAGNLYIDDWSNSRIRKVNTSGIISTIAGGGSLGYNGDGIPATTAWLNYPNDVAVDAVGNVYIADRANYRIRKINTSGIISTFAGVGVSGHTGDGGLATLAQISEPWGLDIDAAGNLYIADRTNNNCIRKVTPAGIISTVAGTGVAAYSGDGGLATAAGMSGPRDLAVDANGFIYVADYSESRVRKIGNNSIPFFINGASQTVAACTGLAVSLDTALAIMDTDFVQQETWAVLSTPLHGTLSLSFSTLSTRDTIYPTGLSYTGTIGYTGTDSFRITIFDGINYDTTTVHITLTSPTFAGVISGPATVCTGSTISLATTGSGGAWSSAATSIASVGSTGTVGGVSAGADTILYIVTSACGHDTARHPIVVNTTPFAGVISGTATLCGLLTTTLTTTGSGGNWSSSSSAIATVNGTGVVTAVSPGIDTISYTVTTACGTDTARKTIIISPVPAADTITGLSSVCVGSIITLTDTASGGNWSSTLPGIGTINISGIVTGITPGTVVIHYTVSNICGTSIASHTVTVDPLAAVGPITGTASVCVGAVTTLSATPAGGTWYCPSPAIATVNSNGGVSGVSAGTAVVSYSLTNSCGTATTMRTVTVNALAVAGTIMGSASVCAGDTTGLWDLAGSGNWSSISPGIATINNAGLVSGVLAGTALISYTVINSCGTVAATRMVTVHALPTVYPVTGGGSFCAGGTGVHVFLGGSDTGVMYQLYNGGAPVGSAVAGTGVTLDFGSITVPGYYTVSGTRTSTGCYNDMSNHATISINPLVTPSVSITNTGIHDTSCLGAVVTFTALPVNGGASPAYQWTVNGSVTGGSGASYSYVPANGDLINVMLTSSNACAVPFTALASDIITVIPYQMPSVSIVASENPACSGSVITYTASSLYGGTPASYRWTKNNTNVATGPVYYYPPANGDSVYCMLRSNYICRLSDSVFSNGISETIIPTPYFYVTITGQPGTNVLPGEQDTLTATVTGSTAVLYQWLINGAPIPGATTARFISTFNHHDSVTCEVTDTTTCGYSVFKTIFIEVGSTGIPEAVNGGGDIRIVPNPNHGDFMIEGWLGNAHIGFAQVDVVNMLGQTVYSNGITIENGKVAAGIDLGTEVSAGVYLLILRTQGGDKQFHLVIEK